MNAKGNLLRARDGISTVYIYIYIHVKSSTGRLREREGDPLAYDLRNNNTFHYFRLQRRNSCVQW